MKKRVVTQGKGNNLFKISGLNKLIIYQVYGDFTTENKKIGSARSLDDALSLIKAYSGKQIKEIREW